MQSLEKKPVDLIAESVKEAKELKEYPLTPSQMGIYFACVSNPAGTMYNIPLCFTFKLSDGIDIEALVAAVKGAIKNHESLKFRIDDSSGSPVMRPCSIKVDIPVINSSDSELSKIKSDFVKPFDLKNDTLFRILIVKTETKLCLLCDFHHIVFDGTSSSVLFGEVSALYSGREIEPEYIGQFGMSVFEQKFEQTEEYKQAHDFYENSFDGL